MVDIDNFEVIDFEDEVLQDAFKQISEDASLTGLRSIEATLLLLHHGLVELPKCLHLELLYLLL
jgi:hypothetical protein